MSPETVLGLFSLIIAVSYAVQTVTGFGSMVVCVTIGAHLMDIREIVTLAVPLSFLQTGYVAIRHRDGIEWRLLSRRVLPWMCGGMGLAFAFLAGVDRESLRVAFGIMVLALGLRELWRLHAGEGTAASPISAPASTLAIFGAGVIHGVYATGGPLLVYALGREDLGKHVFRSTLTMVWFLLSIVLMGNFIYEGRYDADTGMKLLWLLPGLPVGIAVGEWVHRRVEERRFKFLIFGLLVVASVTLLMR